MTTVDETETWRLDIEYEGTPFCGWARQPGRRSIEGELETALATVLGLPVRLRVAGRTDAGVHASGQIASFRAARAGRDPRRLRLALNALLPPEIAVREVSRAAAGFDARAAAARTYRYRLWLDDARPVFERRLVWDVRGPVDTALLAECVPLLVGRHDFSALTPSARLYRSCVREVTGAAWLPKDDRRETVFEITAGGFLHNMVRVAVGTMVDVAQGRMTVTDLRRGLEGGRRAALGRTAPARGLSLVAVRY